jgi:SNF2 family DNA or RNA helicase
MSHDEVKLLEPRLYDFQAAGVAFINTVKNAILADEMGSGKTIQATVAARIAGALPLLVIAPNTMKRVWKRELEKWWPGIRCAVLTGGAAARRKLFDQVKAGELDCLISNWELLRHHSRLAPYGSIASTDAEKAIKELNEIDWVGVIADEAHRAKNPKAKQTRALWAIGRQPSVRFRLAMTGTPIGQNPADMWALLNFIEPSEWPSKTRYVDRYCLASFNAFGGLEILGLRPDTQDEFYQTVDPHLRRLPKEVTMPFLPKRLGGCSNPDGPPIIRYAEMSPKQAKAYNDMASGMLAQLEEGAVIALNPISQLTRLMQFASAYATLDDNGDVQLTAPSSKVDALLEILDEFEGEPIVAFAQSRQLIMLASEALTKAGIQHSLIVGDQTEAARMKAIDDFQDGKVRAILCTISAGGVGVTLTRSRVCVFLQRSFSMVENVQAEARIHRIGSEHHENVMYIDVVSENTIDERMLEVLGQKAERLEEIVRDRQTVKWMIAGANPTIPNRKRKTA